MTRYTAAALYAGSILSFFALAARRWSEGLPAQDGSRLAVPHLRAMRIDSLASILDSAESRTVVNDPFRLSNSPPSVRYRPGAEPVMGSPVASTQAPARPPLRLTAIVGGPPWQAMIDGIPGQPTGAVARSGSVFGTLSVRAVTRDSVIVQGPDTTWVLSFRRSP